MEFQRNILIDKIYEMALKDKDIFFGHWPTLKNINIKHVYAMDHGCVWGEQLSTFRLSDRTLISQESIEGN